MNWDVVDVHTEAHLSLRVAFADGTCGVVRFMPAHLTGVFAPLRDPHFFAQVFIEGGALTWPGEVDLAPDAVYRRIKQEGVCILQ